MKERQQEEQRRQDEEMVRRQQEEMQLSMLRQEEEMRRRQQENTLFMQVCASCLWGEMCSQNKVFAMLFSILAILSLRLNEKW